MTTTLAKQAIKTGSYELGNAKEMAVTASFKMGAIYIHTH
jgi:hypothetical protein